MRRLNLKKRGFTLAEVVVVCTIFAMMIVGIILGINRAFEFMNNTRLLVRATNFSREGVEMVYNIRDTNRRRCSGSRDKARLYVGGSENCNSIKASHMLKAGIYVITGGNTQGDTYLYMEKLGVSNNKIENFYSSGFFTTYQDEREKSKLTFSGTYSYYSGGNIVTGDLDELLSGVDFYRIVRVFGVYCKNSSNNKPDQIVNSTNCKEDSDPKEVRFCVKTFYTLGNGEHASELCSIMTNFME